MILGSLRLELIQVIDRLRSPPDDLSTLPHPDIDDPATYNDALKDLSPHTSLYAATFSETTPEWGSKALDWTKTGPSQARIVQWASRGLSEGPFDSQVWFEALMDDGNTVLREVFVQWGKDDLTVSNEYDGAESSHACPPVTDISYLHFVSLS